MKVREAIIANPNIPHGVFNRMALRKAKTIDLQGFSILGTKKKV
jgi:hypothetical protein